MTATPLSPPSEEAGGRGIAHTVLVSLARLGVSILVPLVAFVVLWAGFVFLRDAETSKLVIGGVAIAWGVGGVALLYVVANWLVERIGGRFKSAVLPYVFVGPAIAILAWYLAIPTVRSLVMSLQDAKGVNFVGLDNYVYALTNETMLTAIRNNVIWLIAGTGFSVGLGLALAVLVDRSRLGALAKILIFLPMAISFVGAGVIWRFVYSFQPAGAEQIGLLNAVLAMVGVTPQAWLTIPFWNNFFLVAILVWSQTGFAMVILGAALRGVPDEMLEAARIDGASEWQVFARVILPSIRGSILTVTTTIAILTLKIYDIVTAMTGGNFGTDVIATLQYKQMFTANDLGRASALAIILLIAVSPVVVYNLRQFRGREGFR